MKKAIMKQRVRAIIIENDQILLIHRTKPGKDYWVFPGGGVEESDENSEQAIIRECKEELGVDVRVKELFTTEIFNDQTELFYKCEIISGDLGSGTGPEFQPSPIYKGTYKIVWVKLADIDHLNIQPKKIAQSIKPVSKS